MHSSIAVRSFADSCGQRSAALGPDGSCAFGSRTLWAAQQLLLRGAKCAADWMDSAQQRDCEMLWLAGGLRGALGIPRCECAIRPQRSDPRISVHLLPAAHARTHTCAPGGCAAVVVRTAGSARFVLRKCEREERSKALPRGSVIARPHPRGAHEHTTTCNVSARIDRQSDAPSRCHVNRFGPLMPLSCAAAEAFCLSE